ncbi:hypothetical protein [Yinghuangia seranimata]|uniref:hypothetical protein n=1 Tax=Yinghuangia seranimata TaxID=408067 RepID=UPI00248CDC2A|nr:hypothetical protein [Yinghuangia seranimata]MDI2131183.1 hypothetical protein [Yinghuangia seranimata]
MTSPVESMNPGDQYAEAAGDPGEAADLAVTTGRAHESGMPDVPLDESLLEPAEGATP